MKDEKKPKNKTFYRFGFCLLLAVVFFTVSLQPAARERTVVPGNSGLFNPYGYKNGLFSHSYWFGVDISNQEQIEPIKDKPRVSNSKLFGEILMGMVGNIGGGFLGGLIGSKLTKNHHGGVSGGVKFGIAAGSIFGSALGVYAVGNSEDAKGSFGSALLGSLLGVGAAGVVWSITKDETTALISFIILPPIGAALMFNRSLRYKSLPLSNALLNFNQGDFKVGIPYVHIQPLPGYAKNVKPTIRFDVNLLNIVF